MRLIEALQVINAAREGERPTEAVYLLSGFTPAHLQTFITARLQQRAPARRVVAEPGVFGDLIGNIERAVKRPAGIAVVLVEWGDLDARLGLRVAGGWSPASFDSILDTARLTLRRLEGAIATLSTTSPTTVSAPTLPLPPVAFTPEPQASAFELRLRALVAETMVRLAETPGVRVLNAQRLDRVSPLDSRHDAASELATGFPYTTEHAGLLAAALADVARPAAPKKGLISDLDDTVWRGILGDVGVDGISWHLEHKTQVHGLYQQLLASLADAGVLVAISSKNDAALVTTAFERQDMVLKATQVFPIVANWRAKSEAVRSILETWNIAADSVVFVDDSPMELAEVQAQHPGIECVAFPKDDPRAVITLLRRLRDTFGKPAVLREDQLRRESIRSAVVAREALASSGEGTEDFLAQAEAVVTLDFRKNGRDARPFELLNKTNQFNLNGVRLSEADWRAIVNGERSFTASVAYRDKYGALGTIAVLAGSVEDGTVKVDHWVMSCRAFARRIEHQSLRALFDRFNGERVELDYRPTERNGPTQEFLAEFFDLGGGAGRLTLTRDDFHARTRPTYHTLEELDAETADRG